tara:strand:+ start:448 stop:651 length:204 start_codon:yes stop_codon:yes gene_type:complete
MKKELRETAHALIDSGKAFEVCIECEGLLWIEDTIVDGKHRPMMMRLSTCEVNDCFHCERMLEVISE